MLANSPLQHLRQAIREQARSYEEPHQRPTTGTKKPPEGGFSIQGNDRADYFSAALRRPFRVFIGASTTKLLASQDGMLPPGSVCTW